MTDLIIRSRNLAVSMGGASSVKSESRPSSFALVMCFGGTVEITTHIDTVNTIVIESVSSIVVGTDYDSISTNKCIGTSIQTHGPPMVDIKSYLHSFTVFTVNSRKCPTITIHYKTNKFKLNRICG